MADDDSPADELAASLTARVHDVLASAERAASRTRENAEADAERLLERAEREAQQYLDGAIRRVDAFAAGRARRISEVADQLLVHAQALADRAERAGRLERGIDAVVDALAAAAEAVAAEAQRAPIVLPGAREPIAEVTRLTTRPHAVPDPEPAADGDDARAHVREIVEALPRRREPPRRIVPPPVEPPRPPDDAA